LKAWNQVNFGDAAIRQLPEDLQVTAPITGGKPAPLFPKIET
jgi:hypothetical protein